MAGTAMGAFGHGWYMMLERRFPGTQFRTIVKKIAGELIIGIPIGTGFIMSICLLEGLSVGKSLQEVKEKFPIMYIVSSVLQFVSLSHFIKKKFNSKLLISQAECALWPPIQFVNFYYLHPKYRFLYVSIAMLFWDVFLSYILHKVCIVFIM